MVGKVYVNWVLNDVFIPVTLYNLMLKTLLPMICLNIVWNMKMGHKFIRWGVSIHGASTSNYVSWVCTFADGFIVSFLRWYRLSFVSQVDSVCALFWPRIGFSCLRSGFGDHTKCSCISNFHQNNWAHTGVTHCGLVMPCVAQLGTISLKTFHHNPNFMKINWYSHSDFSVANAANFCMWHQNWLQSDMQKLSQSITE